MPLTKTQKRKNYTYALWKIEESMAELLRRLQATKQELVEIHNLKNIKRRKQNIAARLTLNHLSNKKEILCYSKYGKPLCRSFKHISISHSNEYCMLVVSDNEIGVDIQHKHDNIKKISTKFLNTSEKLRINKTKSMTELHFIWSAKEAIYKTLDNQPCSFKDSINIPAIGVNIKTTGCYKHNNNEIKYNLQCEMMDNYFIVIANQKL